MKEAALSTRCRRILSGRGDVVSTNEDKTRICTCSCFVWRKQPVYALAFTSGVRVRVLQSAYFNFFLCVCVVDDDNLLRVDEYDFPWV